MRHDVWNMNELCHIYECVMSHMNDSCIAGGIAKRNMTFGRASAGFKAYEQSDIGLHTAMCFKVTHCSTLQHTAAHCNTLQHTATHYSTLLHTETHCRTTHSYMPCHVTRKQELCHVYLGTLTTHCNTLQHVATR